MREAGWQTGVQSDQSFEFFSKSSWKPLFERAMCKTAPVLNVKTLCESHKPSGLPPPPHLALCALAKCEFGLLHCPGRRAWRCFTSRAITSPSRCPGTPTQLPHVADGAIGPREGEGLTQSPLAPELCSFLLGLSQARPSRSGYVGGHVFRAVATSCSWHKCQSRAAAMESALPSAPGQG